MEKTGLNLYNLWDDITKVEYDAKKISLLISNASTYNDETVMVLDMINDYANKVIKGLKDIESIFEKVV